MSEILQELRKKRSLSGITSTNKTGVNTKTPIYDRIQQTKILRKVNSMLGSQYALFYRLSVATGWRTTDLTELKFSDIDFSTGTAKIIVNKQTRAAEKRAYNKHLATTKNELKKRAAMNGDSNLHMKLDLLDLDLEKIIQFIPENEIDSFYDGLETAVTNAPVKADSKKIPKKLLDELSILKSKNIKDDFVFSKSLSNSNRSRNFDGCISRQSVWKAFRAVFDWFANEINSEMKLSAYSLRKTFAYNMLKGKSGDQNNIGEVMESFGHSSIQMTMKYLGLGTKAQELQQELAEMV